MNFIQDQFEACIIGGAIGDAWGSGYENEIAKPKANTFFLRKPAPTVRHWAITDDTQLTLATCEALFGSQKFSPELLAVYFVRYYQQRKLSGIGASTLKALRELELGGHWSQVGRTGEYAAGNGAAMRIAPFAFDKTITRETVRDVCRITHRNEEAYAGALAVFLTIRLILNGQWLLGNDQLIDLLIPQLPDTAVKDRLMAIHAVGNTATISEISKWGNGGYVVDSVPFAIFSAMQVKHIGITEMFRQIIDTGGDTDTNASISGQIAGTLLGMDMMPNELVNRLKQLHHYQWMNHIIMKAKPFIAQ